MAEPDLFEGLHALAEAGEKYATPLAPEEVRRLGNRRRHRRYSTVGVAAVAVLALGGGALSAQLGIRDRAPNPSTPQATLASVPPPRVSAATSPPQPGLAGLSIGAKDIPLRKGIKSVQQVSTSAVGSGQVTVCDRVSPSPLRGPALQVAFQEVRQAGAEDSYPLKGTPNIYSEVFSFADAPAARQAYEAYGPWLIQCPEKLAAAGYLVRSDSKGPLPAQLYAPMSQSGPTSGVAEFTEIRYQLPGRSTTHDAYWQSIGITAVGRRLTVLTLLFYGPDSLWAPDPKNDPAGAGPHIFTKLLPVAARKLG